MNEYQMLVILNGMTGIGLCFLGLFLGAVERHRKKK